MKVTLSRSPIATKKWRVSFPDGGKVDFGASNNSDYTIHKDARRMLLYLHRHGGITSKEYASRKNWSEFKIHSFHSALSYSYKEYWEDPYSAGFWSRWLLWSETTVDRAIGRIQKLFGIKVVKEASRRSRR
jgi:hypothetical protein